MSEPPPDQAATTLSAHVFRSSLLRPGEVTGSESSSHRQSSAVALELPAALMGQLPTALALILGGSSESHLNNLEHLEMLRAVYTEPE